ncbi:hypothetical protein BTZ20_0201 [Rhodococcus sp. MTM3W5.2]|nr:hypothetical protein BTZ20_0201 [Rhodococcus sp. MTM3W5.2]
MAARLTSSTRSFPECSGSRSFVSATTGFGIQLTALDLHVHCEYA